MNAQEISKAIGAHGLWKQRLANAINTGTSDVTPDQVEPDNRCEFGIWLASLGPTDRDPVHFAKVKQLHAAFHKEASSVLRQAIGGQKAAAEKSMAPKGAYANISGQLTTAMMAWKKAVGG
jgi:hypothetical protein